VTRRTEHPFQKHWSEDTSEAGRLAISVAVGIIFDRLSNNINTAAIPYLVMSYVLLSVVVLHKLPTKLFPRRIGRHFLEGLRWYRGIFCGALFGSTLAFYLRWDTI
jgi:hypothetical protein